VVSLQTLTIVRWPHPLDTILNPQPLRRGRVVPRAGQNWLALGQMSEARKDPGVKPGRQAEGMKFHPFLRVKQSQKWRQSWGLGLVTTLGFINWELRSEKASKTRSSKWLMEEEDSTARTNWNLEFWQFHYLSGLADTLFYFDFWKVRQWCFCLPPRCDAKRKCNDAGETHTADALQ
jgi:hypothetical protein